MSKIRTELGTLSFTVPVPVIWNSLANCIVFASEDIYFALCKCNYYHYLLCLICITGVEEKTVFLTTSE